MKIEPFKIPAPGLWLARLWRTMAAPIVALAGWRPGVRKTWDWVTGVCKRHYLTPVYLGAAALTPVWAMCVYWALVSFAELLTAPASTDPEAARASLYSFFAVVTALGAVFSPPFILIRVWVNERQARTAEQGHITDRITKAIEQLGAEKTVKKLVDGKSIETTEPNLEVRLGAIYALERIAQDSLRDHIPIMETLCAYVRENSHHRAPVELSKEYFSDDVDRMDEWLKTIPPLRIDIQTAMTVMGRRDERQRRHELDAGYRLDLQNANLQRADLCGAELTSASLSHSWLAGANLSESKLAKALFKWTQMQSAKLTDAHMQKADLEGAKMQGADLGRAQMQKVKLKNAQMQKAKLIGAKMQKTDLIGAKMQEAVLIEAQMQKAILTSAQMQKVDLRRAQMQKADFTKAQMENANLSYAKMQKADLRHAQMKKANFTLCDLRGANARSANFADAENMTQDQVSQIFGDQKTQFPSVQSRTTLLKHKARGPALGPDPEYKAWLADGAPPGEPIDDTDHS